MKDKASDRRFSNARIARFAVMGSGSRFAGLVHGRGLTLVPADRLGVRLGVFFRQDGGG